MGRSYYPGFSVDKEVHVSYGTPWINEKAHEHDIPIQISEPEKFYLFVEIDDRTYVKEVGAEMFRDAKNTVMARYVERRERTYTANSAEEEKLGDRLSGLEITGLELKTN